VCVWENPPPHTHTHTHTHTYMHACIHTYIHTYTYTEAGVLHIHTHTHTHTHTHRKPPANAFARAQAQFGLWSKAGIFNIFFTEKKHVFFFYEKTNAHTHCLVCGRKPCFYFSDFFFCLRIIAHHNFYSLCLSRQSESEGLGFRV